MGVDVSSQKGVTGEALGGLQEKRRKARERKAKSRANQKAKASGEKFDQYAQGSLAWFREVRWGVYPDTWEHAVEIAKEWARAVRVDGPRPGETLEDFERRVLKSVCMYEPKTGLYINRILNTETGELDALYELTHETDANAQYEYFWPTDREIVQLKRAPNTEHFQDHTSARTEGEV